MDIAGQLRNLSLSAVVLTKNSQRHIQDTIKSLDFCREIIVIDDISTDSTVEAAKRAGARVFVRELGWDFAAQRNYGLDKATGEWVLFVDSDEVVDKKLANEIREVINSHPDNSGYYILRRDYIFGREVKFGEAGNMKLIRLGRKGRGRWERPVHEVWELIGKVGELKNSIRHYPHPSVTEFLAAINKYSDLNAQYLFDRKTTTNILEIIGYPTAKFIQNYIFRQGFRDGTVGIIYALMMSFHSFLSRAKLYLKH